MVKEKTAIGTPDVEWKVLRYKGILTRYLISNKGHIWDKEKQRFVKHSYKWTNHKQQEKKYAVVGITLPNKTQVQIMIHRAVAENFLGIQLNKVVDHIDDNPINNDVNNLQWLTIGENVAKSLSKPVIIYEYDITNKIRKQVVGIYKSVNEAARQLNLSAGNIVNTIQNKRKHTRGYTAEYL
jgi:hypothetical protein